MLINSLNDENILLQRQTKELRKTNEIMNGDILLKNQVIEDNNMKHLSEV